MMNDQMSSSLAQLNELQRRVIELRYGFTGETPLSLQATADRLDVGVRRVRRAEEEALEILRSDSTVQSIHETL